LNPCASIYVREPPVVPDVRELHLDLGQHAVHGQPLEEVAVLELVQEVAGGERRVYGHPGSKLDDLRVDHLDALLAGHRDAVVTVVDEVGVPDLEQAHRRQLLGPVHDLVYPPPAGAEIRFGRQEGPVEVPVAPDAADDLVDRYLAHPKIYLRYDPERPPYLLEGEQLVGTRVPSQVSAYPP
jgi:hypothetical protein